MKKDKDQEKESNPFDLADSDTGSDADIDLQDDDTPAGCSELNSYMEQMEAFSMQKSKPKLK